MTSDAAAARGGMPPPVPDSVSAPFWEGLLQHKLLVQQCSVCATFHYPPTVVCANCLDRGLEFVEVPPLGALYARTVMHQAFTPALADAIPYVLALVEIEGAPGVKMMMNVVGEHASAVPAGARGDIVFETRGEWMVPAFSCTPDVAR